ncbi:hypothetical protein L3Q82_007411 [Scortum barcoo]|uniref:Uncharacterized protein n=1 Tax=Scortum barcoo TaxID=214431 RepID=A0ACB8WS90_9TELE|nr:hypothetical protein L3Q82_007411 [Scortum barcoo]
MIRKGKDCYRRKMEHQLQQNNICGVWKGLKTISGFKEPKSQPVGDQGWANDLNLFFNRFDQASAPPPAQSSLLQPPSCSVPPVHCSSCAPSPPLTTLSSHLPLPPSHNPQFTPTLSSHLPPPDTATSHSVLCTSPPSTPPCSSLLLTTHQVRNALKKNRARKAAGPDGISSRLLKSCADQLCGIFRYTFNLSLKLGRVPQLWKTSCIVPVPKTPHPKELNSYRPVALTSHLMKTLERLVLAHLRPLVSSFMDPLQFAYQPDIGVDDAVIYLLHTSLTHLEKAGSTKFSDDSAVVGLITDGDDREYRGLIQDFADWCLRNNLQINAGKTKELVVDFRRRSHSPPAPVSIQGMDIDTVKSYKYLGVHLNDSLDWSDNTNALVKKGNSRLFLLRRLRSFGVQGPLLRTFYDSVVASAIFYGIVCWASSITDRDRRRNGQTGHSDSSGQLLQCERLLHPRCVKERSRRTEHAPPLIHREAVEFLGIHITSDLTWSMNTAHLVKKAQQRLFFLRKLKHAGLSPQLLTNFYRATIESILCPQCSSVVWQLHCTRPKGLSPGGENSTGDCGKSSSRPGLNIRWPEPEEGPTYCHRPYPPGKWTVRIAPLPSGKRCREAALMSGCDLGLIIMSVEKALSSTTAVYYYSSSLLRTGRTGTSRHTHRIYRTPPAASAPSVRVRARVSASVKTARALTRDGTRRQPESESRQCVSASV